MVKWLGFLPCPMHGPIVVQQSKLVRTPFIQKALSGALSVTRYRSLLGFLEHLKVLLSNAKTRMYGLYRPLKQGQEITQSPATLVRIDDRMRTSLQAWVLALATTAAARLPTPSRGNVLKLQSEPGGSSPPMLLKKGRLRRVLQATCMASFGYIYTHPTGCGFRSRSWTS